ncbi:uncharacterized protein LOC131997958 [Stomoxys calcitrans]|uniref:uncharacterized protein LOC131997958 n=1 Tax=Stomoxys calcitrans TaxID=35570 RepID=UPI0027E2CFE0|nr:uncharacterized protein LOC131997958 [Stomoxys calcitrans]
MSTKIVFLLCIALCLSQTLGARRRFNLILNNATCNTLNSLMKIFQCELEKFGTSRYGMNARFMLERPFERNAESHILAYFTPTLAKKAVKFLDLRINICDMLSTVTSIPLMKVILDEVRRTGNLPYRCPVKGNFLYTLKNYSVSAETLPSYMPSMKFNFSFYTYDNQQLISKFVMDGATVSK